VGEGSPFFFFWFLVLSNFYSAGDFFGRFLDLVQLGFRLRCNVHVANAACFALEIL